VDGERCADARTELDASPGRSYLVRAGKRRFARVRFV